MNLKDIPVVILAAGASSRFWPLSSLKHKAMTRICGRPILEYVLKDLTKGGIKRAILVVSPRDEKEIKSYFDNGENLNLQISYAIQKRPSGQANAILSAKEKINSSTFFVMNAHHVNSSYFLEDLIKFKEKEKGDLVLLGTKTNKPWEYGIFVLDGKRALKVIEKPEKGKEPSDIRRIVIDCLTMEFLNFLDRQPTEEYQLEASLAKFMKKRKVLVFKTNKETVSLKYPWDLLEVKNYLLKNIQHNISPKAQIAKTAVVKPPVIIEEGALVGDFAIVEGSAFIGKNAVLGAYSILRKGSVLEESSQAQRYCDLANSILLRGSHIHSGFVGDSIIGENCRIGAGFITANRRIDRKEIKTLVKEKIVTTGLASFGTVVGANTRIGIRVNVMPGKMIGKNCMIGPVKTITKNIPDNSKVL